MIEILERTTDKLKALTSNKDFVNGFDERRTHAMGKISRKKVENRQT